MVNPVKTAAVIDWDKIAKRLGRAFDYAIKQAEEQEGYDDDEHSKYLQTAAQAATALTHVAAEARAAAGREALIIKKPTA